MTTFSCGVQNAFGTSVYSREYKFQILVPYEYGAIWSATSRSHWGGPVCVQLVAWELSPTACIITQPKIVGPSHETRAATRVSQTIVSTPSIFICVPTHLLTASKLPAEEDQTEIKSRRYTYKHPVQTEVMWKKSVVMEWRFSEQYRHREG
jgi:hypothetical protein